MMWRNEMLTADQLIREVSSVLKQRGEQRDSSQGERSMERIVSVFNALHGTELTVEQGWSFMVCLKLVRSFTGTAFRKDDYLDLIGYSGLLGEERYKVAIQSPFQKEDNEIHK